MDEMSRQAKTRPGRRRVLAELSSRLREAYSTEQPMPDRLVELVRRIGQVPNSKPNRLDGRFGGLTRRHNASPAGGPAV
jgi:hypothetical protein